MAIEKKLIHFGKLADFEIQLAAGNILNRSIVFIQDAKKIWTHGTYYDCSGGSDVDLSDYLTSEEIAEVYATIEALNGKQDTLVSGTNIKTINGESILGEGDLTVEGGAKVYELNLTGRGNLEGYITEEEWNIIKDSDRIKIITDYFSTEIIQIYSPFFELNGDFAAFSSSFGIQENVITIYAFYGANATEGSPYSYMISGVSIPTKTSQLENDSNFVSSDGLKTINGESIVGSGDITISGGSSSGGSGAYPELIYTEADASLGGGESGGFIFEIYGLQPNVFHVFPECQNLSISFGPETSGVANEYLFQFTSGSTATSLTLPDDIKWANDSAPTITENMIYQVSVLKGLASVLEFANAPALISNKATVSISGTEYLVSLQYAAASDIIVKVRTVDDAVSVSILSGEISKSASGISPIMDSGAYIESITPAVDNNYIYTW